MISSIIAATAVIWGYEKRQKNSEDALRKNEARLAEAIKIAGLGAWEYDAIRDQFTFNDQFYTLYRTTAEQEGGYLMSSARYAQRFIIPDEQAEFGAEIRKQLETTDSNYMGRFDARALRGDGSTGYFSINIRIEKDADGRTVKTHGVNQDISERKQAEESIEKLRHRNESILDAAGEGILGLDTEGHHTFVNPAAAITLGYTVEELIGKRSHELWHHTKPDGSPRPVEECPIYATFKSGAVHHEAGDVFWRKDGGSFPVAYTSTPIIEQGKVVGAVVAFSNIAEMILLREQLEKLTITDALTGLYNRRGFSALVMPKLKLSQRKMENIYLIYADVDNLKEINDTFGHQEGDKALAEMANILKSTFRESDILARLGGDEFAILAIDSCDVNEKVIHERIQKKIDSYNEKVDPVHRLSLSVGGVCYDSGKPCTLDDLLSQADALMYENKLSKKRLKAGKT